MARHFIFFYELWLILTASLTAGIQMRNVALSGTASQSSTNMGADKAIDGNRSPRFNSSTCSLTDEETDPWWKVDLRETFKIHSVIITSSNKNEYNLNGIEVWVHKSDPSEDSTRCGNISWFPESQSRYLPCDNVRGQFVRLHLSGIRNLSLCEVRVYTTDYDYPPPNVAVKGQAVQSSTLYPAGAHRAIDGRRDSYYTESSCSHTQEETAPWWRVDLGQTFVVSEVKVTNRGDCCPERLDGAQIRIGDSLQNNGNDNPRCASITHIPLGKTFSFTCESGNMMGQYVNLVLPGDKNILTLCEVEVYAKPAVGLQRNIAKGKETGQSSQWEGDGTPAGAYKALRVCNKQQFSERCCIRTEEEWGPWWRVDLGAVYRVSVVAIYNRKDCCSEYITGAKIKIGKSLSHEDNPVCATTHSADLKQTFYCSEMEGQYVSLNIPKKTNLTFCGMEVFGSKVEQAPDPPPAPRYTFPNVSAQIGGRTVWLVGGHLCWSDSLLYCRRHQWDLLSIHSQDEQMQVEQLVRNSSLYPLSDHVWLGLRREVMGLKWFWMSGEAVTFDNWKLYPPLFPNPCGGMDREPSLWSPLPCEEHNNFLCQSAPAQNTTQVYYYSSKDPMP